MSPGPPTLNTALAISNKCRIFLGLAINFFLHLLRYDLYLENTNRLPLSFYRAN